MKVKSYLRRASVLMIGLMIAGTFCCAKPAAAQEKLSLWGDPTAGEMVGFEAFKVIGLGNRDPRLIIASIVQIALGFLGTLAVLLLLYGGFLWMTSGGESSKIERAKELIKNAIIGLLIILSAFAIATFILRALILSTGAFGGAANENSPGGAGALSAMGAGIIGSVYPEPNQKDVARNTSIIVYFKEAVDPATICDKLDNGKCAADAKILPESIKIFQTEAGDKVETNLTEVRANSNDNKTFVFAPLTYLGTPTEKLWYTVALSTKIMKADKKTKAFSIAGFAWQFEVSNLLDLTPPKVMSAGVFPAPDNEQDQPGQVVEATEAKGSLLVNGEFKTARIGRVTYTKTNPSSPDLNIASPRSNNCDGQIDIAINFSKPLSASIAYRNMPGLVDEPEAAIIDRKIKTACGFDISLLKDADNFSTGQSWSLDLVTDSVADSLIVGANTYTFVDKLTSGKQILVGVSKEATAANIVGALGSNKDLTASIDSSNKAKINVRAKVPGRIGNNLEMLTTATKDTLVIAPLAGGTDRIVSIKVLDKSDKPKNAVIQVNFDEAINPLSLSGRSEILAKNIAVMNGDVPVAGEFRLSNQYKTVEFVPDQECGMNACGEKVYCLPGGANLRVELKAATLSSICTAANDCAAKTPFNTCQDGVCYDAAASAFYPAGALGAGIVDLASNSLDGNRDLKAVGPKGFYNENAQSGTGDNFLWTFWTSDVLDLTAPAIVEMKPTYNQNNMNAAEPISVKFSKLMMSDSLKPGTTMIKKGDKQVEHALINLRSLANNPVGYWLTSSNDDASTPPDNELDTTTVLINHSLLAALNKYRVQVGSGVKDIYQNCYKPCAGPSCGADSNSPSCCNGTPTDLAPALMCPDK